MIEAFIIQLIDLLKDENKDDNFCNELQENIIQRLLKIGPQHPVAFKVCKLHRFILFSIFWLNDEDL